MEKNILSQKNRYLIRWVGRCQYDTHDKIWGWFFYFQEGYKTSNITQPICYTFWARTGKSPSFKKHDFSKWTMNRLVDQKVSRSYESINIETLEQIWPSFYNDIETRFMFYILSESV